MSRLHRIFILSLILLVFSGNLLKAQDEIPFEEAFFIEEDPLKITLRFNYKQLIKNKFKDEYQACTIVCHLDSNNVITEEIRIKARGNFRKKYCFLPPIRLNMKNTSSPILRPLEKLKLVTNCKSSAQFEQYVLKEFLSYKMYNQLTEYSFRVRLVEITYEDTRGKAKTFTKYGFLIEDVDNLAARNNCKESDRTKVHTEHTNRGQMTLMALYEYFLGNTDWSVPGGHNIKLLERTEPGKVVPIAVPYDFDYSGMVNTQYAIPNEQLGIKTVRERLFRGYARTPNEWETVFKLFNEKRPALEAIIKNCEPLTDYHKRDMLKYIEEFFEVINNPKRAKNAIFDMSRKA